MSADFQDGLRTEAHDLAREAQQVADDAVEASPARAVAVALDAFVDADRARSAALAVLIDANRAVDRADAAHLTAFQAYQAALAVEARS